MTDEEYEARVAELRTEEAELEHQLTALRQRATDLFQQRAQERAAEQAGLR